MNKIRTLTWLSIIMLVFSTALSLAATSSKNTSFEAGVIISEEGIIPQKIYAPKGKAVKLWVLSARKEVGKITLAGSVSEVKKKGKYVEINLAGLKSGKYPLTYVSKKKKEKLTAQLIVGSRPPKATVEVALLASWKNMKPDVTTLPANCSTIIHLYTSTIQPHNDIEILRAGIKLPFKFDKVEAVKIKKGLKKGIYRVWIPGKKESHGIKARIKVK